MDKCPKCGAHARFDKDEHGNVVFCCGSQPFMQQAGPRFAESTECLRRQLAAANERAGRLEGALRAILDDYRKPESRRNTRLIAVAALENVPPSVNDVTLRTLAMVEPDSKSLEVPDA